MIAIFTFLISDVFIICCCRSKNVRFLSNRFKAFVLVRIFTFFKLFYSYHKKRNNSSINNYFSLSLLLLLNISQNEFITEPNELLQSNGSYKITVRNIDNFFVAIRSNIPTLHTTKWRSRVPLAVVKFDRGTGVDELNFHGCSSSSVALRNLDSRPGA